MHEESSLLTQFDQVLVINMDSRPDRLREMVSQLRSIGFDFDARIRRFPAVRVAEAGGFRSPGAHGCFLSHLGCLDTAIQSGARSVMILEDDVDFSADFHQRQQPLVERLKLGDWGMFYGGGHFGGASPQVQGEGDALGWRAIPADALIWTTHCVCIREPWLTLAREYLRAMLRRPAGDPDGGPMDVDGAYSWFRRVHQVPTLMAHPEIAVQRPSSSDITPQWFDQVAGLGALVRRLRAFRRGFRA